MTGSFASMNDGFTPDAPLAVSQRVVLWDDSLATGVIESITRDDFAVRWDDGGLILYPAVVWQDTIFPMTPAPADLPAPKDPDGTVCADDDFDLEDVD